MSRETLQFLRQLLCNQSIPVADPNFVAVARVAGQALAEIDAALAALEAGPAAGSADPT